MPKTGNWSGLTSHNSLLRCTCFATSRSASNAPLRSNLLIATKSAKSSMSIFSSCDAAPNSGVITYKLVETCGTIAASPCPMPDVSIITKSKSAALQAAITSGKAAEISDPASRVANERIKTRGLPSAPHGIIAFIRIRSPNNAPPDLRRDGSIEISAMLSWSFRSKRKRRITSSVNDDLPAPPVPVIPKTGVVLIAACW